MKEYYDNGQLKQDRIMAANGVDFLLVDYYEDGHLKKETPFMGGMWHGRVKNYDSNGMVEVTTYNQGIIEGPWELWHNGKLMMAQDVKLADAPIITGALCGEDLQ